MLKHNLAGPSAAILATMTALLAFPPARGESSYLAIVRTGEVVRVEFTDTLVSAADLGGPWTELTNVASPLVIESPTNAHRFFRLRIDPPSGPESIFDASSVIEMVVSGPLQPHFERAFAGLPDGIFPPVREKPYFPARLAVGAYDLPVTLRVRGNSSLQECPFPKLKFKVSREVRENTPFFDAREVRIGTHCAEGGRGNVGRLRDETATFREALAYELLSLNGFIGPRVRRARIEYRDTTTGDEDSPGGWQITRNALLLDDIEVVGERLGGRALSDEEVAALTNANFDQQLVADLQCFHALIGNWDYAISVDGRGLWNTDVIELPEGTLMPVAGDFDLCSFVTGEVRAMAPRDYRPDLGDVEREALYQLERIRGEAGEALFNAARERFNAARASIETHIHEAMIDEPGRTNALRHVAAFYGALAEIKQP